MILQQVAILILCFGYSSYGLGCYIETERRETIVEKVFFSATVEDSYRNKCELTRDEAAQIDPKNIFTCGSKNVKPMCVCGYYSLKLVGVSACHDKLSDSKTHMTCSECKRMSDNESGPCQNGGIVKCSENDPHQLAIDLKCQCPMGYEGRYCETKVSKVYIICNTGKCESGYKILEEGGKKFNCCNTDAEDVSGLKTCNHIGETDNESSSSPSSQADGVTGNPSKSKGIPSSSGRIRSSISGFALVIFGLLMKNITLWQATTLHTK